MDEGTGETFMITFQISNLADKVDLKEAGDVKSCFGNHGQEC